MAKKKSSASKKPPTKTEVLRHISDKTGLTKKDVQAVFDELNDLAAKNLKRAGVNQFSIPGLCKMQLKKKKKTPAGYRRNPFTGETKWMPEKPARKDVKIRPLKSLKDQVN